MAALTGARAAEPSVQVVDEVVVTADAARDPRQASSDAAYLPQENTTGSRLGGIPADLTQTVDVVPEQLIIDRGALSVSEALETVPGVQPISGVYAGTDSTIGIRSRGFESNYTLIDGARIQAFGFPWDISSVQKLEVLKGPAGVLYGQGDPGGVLNLVTKRPLAQPQYSGRFTGGSFNFYRPEIDLTGPVPGTNGTLLYRLNAAFQTTESYRDFIGSQRYYVAPALTWFLTPQTKLDVFFSYFYERFRFDRGQPADPIIFDLPRSRTVSQAGMPWSNTELITTIAKLEHAFNEDWKVRQFFAFFHQTSHTYEISAFNRIDGTDLFERYASRGYGENKYLTAQTELNGAFETGPFQHKTMLGFEYSYTNFGYGFYEPVNAPTPFNWKDPDYNVDPGGAYAAGYDAEGYGDSTFALYFDHQIDILKNLKLALGSRFDWSFGFYENRVTGQDYPASDSFGWSPRVGLVYSPIPSVDLYGSWARTFKPNLFADGEGNTYDPELGESFELGVRHRFLKNRVQATLAFFHITKDNVLNPDPSDPNGIRQILNGQERSQGFEFDLTGSVLPGWDVTLGYAYVDAEITESTTGEEGVALVDAPRNQLSLFTRYQFQENTALSGFFVGAGMFYVDDRRAAFASPTFELPAYIRYDANIGYQAKNWRVQVNFENLTNVKYYNTHGNNIFPQAPFNVNASLAFNF